jgi:hypothetical protein
MSDKNHKYFSPIVKRIRVEDFFADVDSVIVKPLMLRMDPIASFCSKQGYVVYSMGCIIVGCKIDYKSC